MEKKLIEKTSQLCDSVKELKQLWMDYVRERGEVPLGGHCITMWDGCSEWMEKLTHHDGEVFIVDCFGNEWNFESDTGPETLIELYDVVFVAMKQSSGE